MEVSLLLVSYLQGDVKWTVAFLLPTASHIGIHAREWISPAVVTSFIQKLVEEPENADMISNVDWYIMPVANPDGKHENKLRTTTSIVHDLNLSQRFTKITSNIFRYKKKLAQPNVAKFWLQKTSRTMTRQVSPLFAKIQTFI